MNFSLTQNKTPISKRPKRRLAPSNPLLPTRIHAAARGALSLLAHSLASQSPRSLQSLLQPLYIQARHSLCLRADALGVWEDLDRTVFLPRFRFQRFTQGQCSLKIGIFAGIHGDEPAGILGLMDFIQELDATPGIGGFYELWLYPLCNPTGYLDATRTSRSGKDLNREFWRGSGEREVLLLEQEIRRRQFDGILSLHSDDTSQGFYGFARGDVLARTLLAPALNAAEAAHPRDTRPFIDGFRAVNGMLYDSYDGILSAPPEQSPKPFEIILESPARSPLEHQRKAFTLALLTVLEEYRRFISLGASL